MPRRSPNLLVAVAGAILTGVATIFVPKARPQDHWSTPPTLQVEVRSDLGNSGDPPASR